MLLMSCPWKNPQPTRRERIDFSYAQPTRRERRNFSYVIALKEGIKFLQRMARLSLRALNERGTPDNLKDRYAC